MSAGGPATQRVFHMVNQDEIYFPPAVASVPREHRVTVARHPYKYWRAQCMGCGTIQNWATEDDANWWAEQHQRAGVEW